jgi:hypothetical protein
MTTHYQVSLTTRQAMGLFVGLLAALGLAYFLGVMTGLAGRGDSGPAEEASEAAAPTPAEEGAEQVPVPVRGVEPGVASRPAAEPTASAASAAEPDTIQAFEDLPSEAPASTPAPAAPAGATAIRDGVWVQVYSLSSSA